MQKQIGGILLVAGTSIGSGMIALPMVLSKLGLIPSILLMLITWAVVYYTALASLELNLQAGRGLSLGELGNHFSGKLAGMIGNISIKLLSYALLAVYIYGGSSIIQKLLNAENINSIAFIYFCIACLTLLFPLRFLDYFNRLLFIGLLIVVSILIIGLTSMIKIDHLPLFSNSYSDISIWRSLIAVVFTSFGF